MRIGISLLLLCYAIQLNAGDGSSGGGDPLRFFLKEGKEFATFIVKGLDSQSFDQTNSLEVTSWLLSHKDVLAQDIADSSHLWTEDLVQVTCARTSFEKSTPITLSFQQCRGKIASNADAAKLLIHESAHHLGVIDEEFADNIALAAFRAWENKKVKQLTLCPNGNIISKNMHGKWKGNDAINKQLWGTINAKLQVTVEIRQDLSVLKKYPGNGKCAYDTGIIFATTDEGSLEADYLLYEYDGAQHITYMIKKPNGVPSHWESSYIVLAKAKTGSQNDLLFIGGDSDNEPFTALTRISK